MNKNNHPKGKRIFYRKNGLTAPSQKFIEVKCNACGIVYMKNPYTIVEWKGNCRSCAQKLSKSSPELKNKMSILARKQILLQGGIPNAKKFIKGSTAKDKNWRWISDRSKIKTIKQIRSVYEYQEWRNSVFERDSYTCQECGQRGFRLNAHHIKPFSKYPNLVYEVSNGITLCLECHKRTDTFGGKANRFTAAMTA